MSAFKEEPKTFIIAPLCWFLERRKGEGLVDWTRRKKGRMESEDTSAMPMFEWELGLSGC